MSKKIKTIDLQGKKYAQVAERLRAIHEDHTDFDIVTTYEATDGGNVVFTATLTIRTDKTVVYTGHSFGKVGAQKAFEKLETIAVGRALAFAGYHADGEIASADEMQDYNKPEKELPEDIVKLVENATSLDALKEIWEENKGLGKEFAGLVTAQKKIIKEADTEVVPED